MRAKTILVIDDDITMRSILELALHDIGGFEVVLTKSGREGLEHAAGGIDAVLLDSHMPDLSGKEVLGELKADKETKDLPVIMLTADSDPQLHEELKRAGALAVVLKPVDPMKLADAIKALLDY